MIPQRNRLEKNRVEYILKKGTRKSGKHFNLKYLPSSAQQSRFCVIVSLKVAPKAVLRNRLRRQIYEIIRCLEPQLVKPQDIILITKPDITSLPFIDLKNVIIEALKHLHE